MQGLAAGSSRLLALLLGVETFKAILEGCQIEKNKYRLASINRYYFFSRFNLFLYNQRELLVIYFSFLHIQNHIKYNFNIYKITIEIFILKFGKNSFLFYLFNYFFHIYI